MTGRPGWRPANVYVPQLVDLDVLRARLADYMSRPRLAARSEETYEQCLSRFRRWCESREVVALPTSVPVLGAWMVAALTGAARVDAFEATDEQGTVPEENDERPPLSMTVIDQTWAALAWWHHGQKLTSPTDDAWAQTVRRGLRRALAGHQVRKAHPLSPDDVRTLASVEATWTPVGLAERALLLAAVDLPLPLAELAVVPPSALQLTSPTEGTFSCSGRTAALRCADDGCGADCLLCALWACAQLLPAEAPYLFGIASGVDRDQDDYRVRDSGEHRAQATWAWRTVHARMRSGKGCWPIELRQRRVHALGHVAADARLMAGLRLGLTLSTSDDGLRLLQQRAGLLLSWHRGLRSDDLRRRSRRCLERTEQGYKLTVEASKGDRRRRGVVLGVRPAQDPLLDPVAALDDWLAVLDAAAAGMVAEDGLPVFVRCPRGTNLVLKPVTYNWMWRHFADLQRRAGLSGFTLHSTRTGFAVTGADAQATVDQLRRVMRQERVNVAVGYVMARAARSRPAPLALARAAGAA
ncbi:hypothetical protein [Geodermatophilus sp. SYSU D00684]